MVMLPTKLNQGKIENKKSPRSEPGDFKPHIVIGFV